MRLSVFTITLFNGCVSVDKYDTRYVSAQPTYRRHISSAKRPGGAAARASEGGGWRHLRRPEKYPFGFKSLKNQVKYGATEKTIRHTDER